MHVEIASIGEQASLLTLGNRIDGDINRRVHALAGALRGARIDGMRDIVPAYASVLLRHGLSAPADVRRWQSRVREVIAAIDADDMPDHGTVHRLAVCYDGADLEHVAQACHLSPQDVITRHVRGEYRVAMIGFAPGFPYLIGMDPALATPRRDSPRTRVPAGAVAIGGSQTGIYPRTLPGGWHLIGRVDRVLFDADNNEHPCLLLPGDRVRLHAVDQLGDMHWEKTPC